MYTAESSLLSPPIGTAEQWIGVVAKRNPTDAEAVVRAYFDLAPRVFINADLALAQCMLETGWLTSELFKTRRNMAGLGITGPGVLGEDFERRPLPWDAAFLAGKAFLSYRRAGGQKRSPLPDFYVGAHATVEGLTLVTRDPKRYRRYFPKLALLAPPTAQAGGLH